MSKVAGLVDAIYLSKQECQTFSIFPAFLTHVLNFPGLQLWNYMFTGRLQTNRDIWWYLSSFTAAAIYRTELNIDQCRTISNYPIFWSCQLTFTGFILLWISTFSWQLQTKHYLGCYLVSFNAEGIYWIGQNDTCQCYTVINCLSSQLTFPEVTWFQNCAHLTNANHLHYPALYLQSSLWICIPSALPLKMFVILLFTWCQSLEWMYYLARNRCITF